MMLVLALEVHWLRFQADHLGPHVCARDHLDTGEGGLGPPGDLFGMGLVAAEGRYGRAASAQDGPDRAGLQERFLEAGQRGGQVEGRALQVVAEGGRYLTGMAGGKGLDEPAGPGRREIRARRHLVVALVHLRGAQGEPRYAED